MRKNGSARISSYSSRSSKVMNNFDVDPDYQALIDAATQVLRKNAHPVKHSVGAALLCASGRIYTGGSISNRAATEFAPSLSLWERL
jgi:hypothetical protein